MRLLKDSNPTAKMFSAQNSFHDGITGEKELCLVWETGRNRSFVYRDYSGVDFHPEIDPLVLTLYFIGWAVTLKGYNLDRLAVRIVRDKPEIIAVQPERYAALSDTGQFFIHDAVVKEK